MKYKLPNTKGEYLPNLYEFLAGVDEEKLYYKEHGLLHPADIYLEVFDEVVRSGTTLLKALDEMNHDYSKRKDDNFYSLILRFLFSLSNYIDGCQSITKTFYPKGSKLIGKVNRDFKSQCGTYIDYVNAKVNYIKHRHRKLATCLFQWEKEFIIAYYIAGIVGDDMIGPEPDLHEDPNCAISLNWDIPFHIFNIYFLSASLEATLRGELKIKNKTNNVSNSRSQEKYKDFLWMASSLTRNLLPDEIYKKQAIVKVSERGGVELSYPSRVQINNRTPHMMDITMTANIGITAQGFVLPYRVRKDYRYLQKKC
ncbi:hypothetical protein [Vibrio vulnificus]|uniref:hypothetical protein n=1 Tax=Vibrio vulnificus TaxID=672 RepID=UPI000CD108CA|nr:hypothetical protein [Vibrio vulnificus]HAV1343317.1 hypothetical protein [Vibrio parahaemolyticus]EHU4978470.1 hypothetical protein [Vibrio vulnificus]MCU8448049.1 hypothetical protein [Vibrio vulnificus]POC31748.1 hypothetical protein CRN38_20845 [Vibrio vulnificus]POC53976.1 hypothetical protein CRN37_19490 [Vibrio vulnificus]